MALFSLITSPMLARPWVLIATLALVVRLICISLLLFAFDFRRWRCCACLSSSDCYVDGCGSREAVFRHKERWGSCLGFCESLDTVCCCEGEEARGCEEGSGGDVHGEYFD